MADKNGGKIFFRILGFLILIGGAGLIGLGLYYIIPDIKTFSIPEELYYIMGGVSGLFIAVIILILAFRKPVVLNQESDELTKQDPNAWNTEPEETKPYTPSRPINSDIKPEVKIKQKEGIVGQTVICPKCGAENIFGEYYCCECKSAMKKICKLCGHGNTYGTETCEGCGKIM